MEIDFEINKVILRNKKLFDLIFKKRFNKTNLRNYFFYPNLNSMIIEKYGEKFNIDNFEIGVENKHKDILGEKLYDVIIKNENDVFVNYIIFAFGSSFNPHLYKEYELGNYYYVKFIFNEPKDINKSKDILGITNMEFIFNIDKLKNKETVIKYIDDKIINNKYYYGFIDDNFHTENFVGIDLYNYKFFNKDVFLYLNKNTNSIDLIDENFVVIKKIDKLKDYKTINFTYLEKQN